MMLKWLDSPRPPVPCFLKFCICLFDVNYRAKLTTRVVHVSPVIRNPYSESLLYLTLAHLTSIPCPKSTQATGETTQTGII